MRATGLRKKPQLVMEEIEPGAANVVICVVSTSPALSLLDFATRDRVARARAHTQTHTTRTTPQQSTRAALAASGSQYSTAQPHLFWTCLDLCLAGRHFASADCEWKS